MKPNEYQRKALRTLVGANIARIKVEDEDKKMRLVHAALGLASESGELCSLIEKWGVFQQELELEKLVSELGDCLWYIALACYASGVSLENVMEANIAKLKARYPGEFDLSLKGDYIKEYKEIMEKITENPLM